jgi:hypothetical protein
MAVPVEEARQIRAYRVDQRYGQLSSAHTVILRTA